MQDCKSRRVPGLLTYTVVLALVMALPMHASAACQETLAEVDRQLAATELDANIEAAVKQFRDQGAALCEQGHDPTATQTLQMVSMMLSQVAAEKTRRQPTAPPPAPAPRPIEDQLATAGDFPNRWDKLSQVDFCQWLTTEELERELDFRVSLSCRDTGKGFLIEATAPGDGWPQQVLMLIVEVHPGQETVRQAEANTADGMSTRFFTPFDAGTSELHVYLANRGHYLYAFPAGGLTLWRLEYLRPGENRDRYYSPSPGRSGNADLGPRFMEMLVDKYRVML